MNREELRSRLGIHVLDVGATYESEECVFIVLEEHGSVWCWPSVPNTYTAFDLSEGRMFEFHHASMRAQRAVPL